jgi:hypothetical protein
MWLLNTRTYELKRFFSDVPRYAILPHTWGVDEPTFDDLATGTAHIKAGYQKIEQSCAIAAESDIFYIWIDTICIDKRSSSELSEAINSMYRYYKQSYICYAYLEDISSGERAHKKIMTSRWWTRGWTLQELIAPNEVIFYSTDWHPIASKRDLAPSIFQATGIDESILKYSGYLHRVSVAKRMSWAAERETTREEDIAYCLLGVFGVSMPLLYGEGHKSFLRLQEEIMKESTDQSLFAWSQIPESIEYYTPCGILALHPSYFIDSGDIVPSEGTEHFGTEMEHYTITNKGLQIRLPVIRRKEHKGSLAILACHREGDFLCALGITLRTIPESRGKTFTRDIFTGLTTIQLDHDLKGILSTWLARAKIQSIYILNNVTSEGKRERYAWLRTYPKTLKPDFEFIDLQMQPCTRWHRWNTDNDTTIPSRNLRPSHFPKKTLAVFFHDSSSKQLCFGILVGDDWLDVYTTNIDIWVPLEGERYPSARYLLDVMKLGNQRKRVAKHMISPNMSITAETSWKMIMNSEVLVIDIFVNKPRGIWPWWILVKETSKILNWPSASRALALGIITSLCFRKSVSRETELILLLAGAWGWWLISLVLGFYEMGPPGFANLYLQRFLISFLIIFLLFELGRNTSDTVHFVIGFGFSLAAGYGSLEGLPTRLSAFRKASYYKPSNVMKTLS